MRLHLSLSTFGFAALLAAGLISLPACDKKAKDTQPDSGPPHQYTGSKGGPPGGIPVPNPGGMPNTGGQPNDPTLPAPPTTQAQTSSPQTRQISQNNLKQIALAFHNAQSAYNAFPTGIADKNGKIGLSWRVAILPFVEQGELFRQFKLDEPWDSENNKKLIAKMPAVYAVPGVSTNGYTYYRSFSGPDTVMPAAVRKIEPGKIVIGIPTTAITDGTSNTLLVAEAHEPVIWTKPDELPYEKGKAPPQLGGGMFADGFNAALCDGQARFFKNGLDPTLLGNLINIRDGQILKLPD
jgi:hypothetical protein